MRSIESIDLNNMTKNKKYTKSPIDWKNQIIYFLLVDRFSDGNEKSYKLYNSTEDYENISKNKTQEEWELAANRWNGGTLKGIESKLKYLKNLGITTIWLSPILKQPIYSENYHGYGIQNFLEIDPHIGTKEDLISLVKKAHALDIYVIMDVIINHTGDVFSYEEDSCVYNGESYPVKGFRDKEGNPTLPFEKNLNYDIDSALWPIELQDPKNFYKKGLIIDWEKYPEYVEGDFMMLKTLDLGSLDDGHFHAPEILNALIKIFKYWIALADLDGFRIDTVKHVMWEATNHFSQSIHEFTKKSEKPTTLVVGWIAGFKNLRLINLMF